MFEKFKKLIFDKDTIISFELDTWHKWYKEPKVFHQAVVRHLINEGYQVETVSIVDTVISNKISILLIDGIKYELSIRNAYFLSPTQSVFLKRIEK